MFDGIVPTTINGYFNLALGLTFFSVVGISIYSFFSSAFRIHREIRLWGVAYEIWGRYPRCLVLYGSYPTLEEAEKQVALLDRMYRGEDHPHA